MHTIVHKSVLNFWQLVEEELLDPKCAEFLKSFWYNLQYCFLKRFVTDRFILMDSVTIKLH